MKSSVTTLPTVPSRKNSEMDCAWELLIFEHLAGKIAAVVGF
jgi:hypothetical protein